MKRAFLGLIMILMLAACAAPAESTGASLPYIDTGVDTEAWALIPAGEFLEGQQNHDVTIDHDYEMMVTDVTNVQFVEYLNDALDAGEIKEIGDEIVGYYPGDEFRGFDHEVEIAGGDYLHVPLGDPGLRFSYDGASFTIKSGYENHPVVMVTWFGAQAYCEFNDWRLPAEIEWEYAARGTDGRPYPWGSDIAIGNANYYGSHDIFEKTVGSLGDTTPVGFYNGQTYEGYQTLDSPSPYGLYDMAGNVWQWTGNVYDDTHLRYMRGGSKMDYPYKLRVWARNNAGPDYYSPSVGFRCARDINE